MEKTRDHIRQRLKVLKDDRKYWEDLAAICVDDRAYYESQAVLKEALISELNWVLRVLEEECRELPIATATNSVVPTADATTAKL